MIPIRTLGKAKGVDEMRKVLLALLAAVMWMGPSIAAEYESYRRTEASGRYADPTSFFLLHGYATATFSDMENAFTTAAGRDPAPGQLLVPRSNVSGAQYDWALFVGSELSPQLKVITESHFVTDPSGAQTPTIVTTEAKSIWKPFSDRPNFRVVMGEYWAPFSIINEDWLSNTNSFNFVPQASWAFPSHYNERGIALEGEGEQSNVGYNYAVSVGNGVQGFSFMQQRGFDFNNDKAVMARIGLIPKMGEGRVELGVSYATMTLRSPGQTALSGGVDGDTLPAELTALAVDLRYSLDKLRFRGYWVTSEEEFKAGVVSGDAKAWAINRTLDRTGLMAEGFYELGEWSVFGKIEAKIRYDTLDRDVMTVTGLATSTVAAQEDQNWEYGLNAYPSQNFAIKAEYRTSKEKKTLVKEKDDGFALSASVSF